MSNDKLLDKLRKVLALTHSPNENEAAAAAEHLQRLLTEHNLEVADLEARGQSTRPGMKTDAVDLGKAAWAWKIRLADMMAEFYYCYNLGSRWGTKEVKFVGRPDNVQALQMLYQWVVEQIQQIAREERRTHHQSTGEHIDPLRWQLHFGLGAVERLHARMVDMKERRDQDQATHALVVHHAAEVSDWLEEHYGYRVDGQPTRRQREREAEQKADEELRTRDPEAYYQKYPYLRPPSPEQQARMEKQQLLEDKKAERRERRREASGYYDRQWERIHARTHSPEEVARRAQQGRAADAGRQAAGRVNLEPFLTGKVQQPPSKRIKE